MAVEARTMSVSANDKAHYQVNVSMINSAKIARVQ